MSQPRRTPSATALRLLGVALLGVLLTPATPARANQQSDRNEQTRYAKETVNLSYTRFLSRKADFTDKGCNADHPKPGGCKKPSPYNKFNWTTDGCSPPTPSWLKPEFSGPCQLHDFGYRNFHKNLTLGNDENTRAWIDGRFRTEMKRVCNDKWPHRLQTANREACFKEADIMWAAVRNFNHWTPAAPVPEPGVTLPPAPDPIDPVPPLDVPDIPELTPLPVTPGGASVQLAQGPAAPAGYRYAITLAGFPANAGVSISCRDSVDPGGFYTFTLTTQGNGSASTAAYCYSGDGPDHWVIANGVESNHVSWGAPPAPTPTPPAPTYAETTGGVAHTWTNYTNAGGTQGPSIPAYATVQIACKLQGFRVADGNTWWYRIASSPWNSAFYVSADAFYNNGQTSGSLHGTPFVDGSVRDC